MAMGKVGKPNGHIGRGDIVIRLLQQVKGGEHDSRLS